MTTKQTTVKKQKPAPKANSNIILVQQDKAKSKDRQIAEVSLSAVTLNSATARSFNKHQMGETDLTETINVMREKISKVNLGNLTELEATLTAQTVSLDAMFNELARRAAVNMGTHMQATESYMRLALKAQSQCARTIEVLAAMKNPPVVFAKQANISHGHQQVNNDTHKDITPRTEKTVNQPNELLEVDDGSEKMDIRAAQTAIPKDKAMATVAI